MWANNAIKAVKLMGDPAGEESKELRDKLTKELSLHLQRINDGRLSKEEREISQLASSSISARLQTIYDLSKGNASIAQKFNFFMGYLKDLFSEITLWKVAGAVLLVGVTAAIFLIVGKVVDSQWFAALGEPVRAARIAPAAQAVIQSENSEEVRPEGLIDTVGAVASSVVGVCALPALIVGAVALHRANKCYMHLADLAQARETFAAKESADPIIADYVERAVTEWGAMRYYAKKIMSAEVNTTGSERSTYLAAFISVDIDDYLDTNEMLIFYEGKVTGSKGQHIATARAKRADAARAVMDHNTKNMVRALSDKRQKLHDMADDILDDWDGVNMSPASQDALISMYDAIRNCTEDLRTIYNNAFKLSNKSRPTKGSGKGKWNARRHMVFDEPIAEEAVYVQPPPKEVWSGEVLKVLARKQVTSATLGSNWKPGDKHVRKDVKQVIKPKLVRAACVSCSKLHATGVCKYCTKVHCFSVPCQQRIASSKKPALQMATDQKLIVLDDVKDNVMKLSYAGVAVESVCWKVRYKKGTYLMACNHQFNTNSKGHQATLKHGGKTYSLAGAEVQHLFEEQDIGLIDWNFFKGVAPQVKACFNIGRPPAIGEQLVGNMTFISVNPQDMKVGMLGLNKYCVTASKFHYNISTANGSCGSLVVICRAGLNEIIAIHAGTQGGGDLPNYGYLLHGSKN
jgi:transcription termination factor NusB